MLFAIGFLVTFLFGGLTGVILASPPLDFAVSDSYFVVAHFHYVLFGTVVFSMFGGFYFWWPKFTGKMLDNRLGKSGTSGRCSSAFNMTFLVQHWIGVEGMPRRVANYPFLPDNVTTLNQISSVGSWILGASTFIFLYNVYKTWRYGEQVTVRRPVGLRELAGVGDLLPAAAAQLHLASRGSGPSVPRSTCTTRTSGPGGTHPSVSAPQ